MIATNFTLTKSYESIITNLKIEIIDLKLFESATLRVLYYENNDVVEIKILTIEGDDYLQWTDDQFLIEWVKSQLNIIIFQPI